MRKGAKSKRKSIITYIIPMLVIVMVVGIIGINITNKKGNKKIETENNKASGYMSEELEKLMESDDENLQSTKYLITDDTIERISENTSVEEIKKEIGKEVKIYKDESLTEEVTEGIIKSGMILEEREGIYTLVVTGDINKDGKVNQIDISKIIRNEIGEISTHEVKEVGIEKIGEKIVYGRYELDRVKEVKSPEIEIVSGEKGENEWYVSDVEIKINKKDEEGEKTVYKIKGEEGKEITEIKEDEKITMTKEGVNKIIAYTYGKEGNKSQIAEKIIKINKTGIEAYVGYSTEEETTESVIATVTFNKEGITITNNEGKDTYEFTKNGEFTFEYIDEAGRKGSITAKVDWIKQEEIVGKDGEWKYFVNDDGTIQLTQYIGSNTEVVVPAKYDGYEVYAVGKQDAGTSSDQRYNVFGDKTLENKTITKITIEEGIKEIKTAAFSKCTSLLGELILPNSLINIGAYSFNGCNKLTGDLIIPDSVIEIGRTAFQNCSGFNGKLKLSNNLKIINAYAFNNCNGLTGDLIIPDNVTEIGRTAFQKCSGFTGNLVLSNNLITIEDYAFCNCSNLTGNLIIPDSVTKIGNIAFQNCSGFNGNLKISDKVVTIGDKAFINCSNLTGNLIIPDSVTNIGTGAFYECTGFNGELTLSNNLITIGEYAFYECSNLTGNLIIPDSVTSIGYAAFNHCSGFNGELKLSANLEYIGNFAFNKCINLKNVTVEIPASLKKIGEDYILDGQNVGIGSHFLYNFGANVRKFEAYEVDENNQVFKSVDGVLYTKDEKRLVSYPINKKDKTYEILEGVQVLDQMSITGNMRLETLIIPNSLNLDITQYPGFTTDDKHELDYALYNYNAIQNIVAKETNPNYKSIDGVLYTKDLKEMVYVSSGRTNEVILPDGVETIRDKAIYYSQIGRKISRMYIPASVINISDETINYLNGFVTTVEVSEDNTVFTVDSNNKLVKK